MKRKCDNINRKIPHGAGGAPSNAAAVIFEGNLFLFKDSAWTEVVGHRVSLWNLFRLSLCSVPWSKSHWQNVLREDDFFAQSFCFGGIEPQMSDQLLFVHDKSRRIKLMRGIKSNSLPELQSSPAKPSWQTQKPSLQIPFLLQLLAQYTSEQSSPT